MQQKPFNSLVVFVRNGVAVPALVVNSQLQADGREFLSLLYADHLTGPQLVLTGATRKVGNVALSVPPLSAGGGFGWFDLPVADAHAALLTDHANVQEWNRNPNTPNMPVPAIDPALVGNPGLHVPVAERQALESDSDHDARLKNLAFQHPPTLVVPKDVFDKEKAEAAGAPEQFDAVQGPVQPGDPYSPHAPGFASFHVAENEDGTLESHPGSYPENNPPSDSEREIAVQKSLAVQE
jgi:hypothetical protein